MGIGGFFKKVRKTGFKPPTPKPGSTFAKGRRVIKAQRAKKLDKWARAVEDEAREQGKLSWWD